MIESLRGLGYTTASALADIIDNSITAGATQVSVTFSWDTDKTTVAILDNGRGMNEAELDSAMRLGEKSPLDHRDTSDLGRFGFGLKTASFSQARRLTVSSKSEQNPIFTLRWDLDLLESSTDDGWHLYEGAHPGSEMLLSPLTSQSKGTLVLWENLDRIVTDGFGPDDLTALMEKVRQHLAMTFHRYLGGDAPRLVIRLNGRSIAPWDPFMTDHPSKAWAPGPVELGSGSSVEVECHVLPHKDRLSEAEYADAGGPEGWITQQGFYLYRNERLLVSGGWLGLGRAWVNDESHKLARIRLDIPNWEDADWKIDIRKSTARPPLKYRPALTRLAEETRERARRVFVYRGQPAKAVGGNPVEAVWQMKRTKTSFRYTISREHPAVRQLAEQSPHATRNIEALLRVIEETVPVQRIWLDTAEEKTPPVNSFAEEPSSEITAVLGIMYRSLRTKTGLTAEEARARLLRTEPFHLYPALVGALPDVPN
jgi:hypothetical protein